jgi:hypothetical protein
MKRTANDGDLPPIERTKPAASRPVRRSSATAFGDEKFDLNELQLVEMMD